MARPRKNIDDQIEILTHQIEKAQQKVDMLTDQRDILIAKKKEQEIGELYDLLQEKGLSVEDIIQMVHEEEHEMVS